MDVNYEGINYNFPDDTQDYEVIQFLEQQNNREFTYTQDDVEQQAYEESLTSGAPLPSPQKQEKYSRYLDISRSIESSNDPKAFNETSGAAGHYQFLDKTFLDFVNKYEPELKQGKSNTELLDLRYDPVVSRRMAGYMADENAQGMQRRNIPVNETNLYITHFLGLGVGLDVLQGDDDTKLEDVMSERSIKNNQSVVNKAKTVGGLKKWAADKVEEHGKKL
jgi:hypothetical protein